jgi:hypothetical protein
MDGAGREPPYTTTEGTGAVTVNVGSEHADKNIAVENVTHARTRVEAIMPSPFDV